MRRLLFSLPGLLAVSILLDINTEVRCALAAGSPVQRNHAHLKLTSSPLPERGEADSTELSNNNNNNKPFQMCIFILSSLLEKIFLFTYIFKLFCSQLLLPE